MKRTKPRFFSEAMQCERDGALPIFFLELMLMQRTIKKSKMSMSYSRHHVNQS